MQLINSGDAWKLANAESNQRVEELRSTTEPTNLEHEIALCRLMTNQAIDQNSPGLAAQLMRTIASLTKAEEQRRLRSAHYLNLDDLVAIAERIGVVVATTLEHHGVTDPDILLEIGAGITEAVKTVRGDRQRKNAAKTL
ncbi:hypothetical protein LF1_48580 [Rubripirellula obstinata]|uniref:Uncharacterized protein n=1 Tax=Rubripirellula obstinata TaxID=406547 RepID=A0A5B1CSV5_9BACT|nr:hypothetical protein [Rubripirellula obstinata]KAA1262294.1 hypothetical protein LF1_48580 [Rubripirellula obstinata]